MTERDTPHRPNVDLKIYFKSTKKDYGEKVIVSNEFKEI